MHYFLRNHGMIVKIDHFSIRVRVSSRTMIQQKCGVAFLHSWLYTPGGFAKSHHNSEILVQKSDYLQSRQEIWMIVGFLSNWQQGRMICNSRTMYRSFSTTLDGWMKKKVKTCLVVEKCMMHRKFNVFEELPNYTSKWKFNSLRSNLDLFCSNISQFLLMIAAQN